MRDQALFDKIDLHLIRVLHTVMTERSVSRAAVKLGMHQPAVSAALKRLREFAGDPLLVRSGAHMVPTDVGLRMVEPAASILRAAEGLFTDVRRFDARSAQRTFRVAASDYLDPLFLPRLMVRLRQEAPQCAVEFYPLSAETSYRQQLEQGDVDVVIGNWPSPSEDLHMGRLFGDEVVCLVSQRHPAVRRGWTPEQWLTAEHLAPTPLHPGAKGFIDDHLAAQGLTRHIAARCAHFGQIPAMVADSLLVLTTGRQYCERFAATLPLAILPCPVPLPRMMYYQLWHARAHQSDAVRWLRDTIKSVAAGLRAAEPAARRRRAAETDAAPT
ncbi:MAG: Nodulation protein D 2 [Paracidovorax wautersii]|uniref:Nodulation protein D 2 n=1 Tax=Paracidovorax wautersii TaxID=1177982 RepID=A0A7V8FQ82_9BURK|nr:MAG: Nodulation protein D 2 [Paracidovorax wautersii]